MTAGSDLQSAREDRRPQAARHDGSASEQGDGEDARAAFASLSSAAGLLVRLLGRSALRRTSAARGQIAGIARRLSARAGANRPAIRVRSATSSDTSGGASPWRRARKAFALTLLAGTAAAFLLVAGFVIYCWLTLPPPRDIQAAVRQRALVMRAGDGQTIAIRGTYRGRTLGADEIPAALKQAVVAIEDRRFYQHHGIDLRGTARAIWRDLRAGGELRQGGSTLTQQLVRNTYLTQEKNLRRKVQEALLALWLETKISKEEILNRYLNTAYFGAGAYGADAAAHRYFAKAAKDMTLAECAMLAGLVRAPSSLSPTRNFGGASEREGLVLQAMAETGAITAEERDHAEAAKVELATPPDTPPGAEYFLDMAAAEVGKLPNGASGDLVVQTTLDTDVQRIAEGVVGRKLDAEGARKHVGQAALVAIRPDGSIVALVGGRDYEASQFDRATQAQRQPGSLFKLFVYLTAFERGLTPDSVMVDKPVTIGDWSPDNDDGRFRGRVDLRTAFAHSINTVAAQLGQAVGIQNVIATARRLGIASDLPNVPSLVLGTAPVNLLEMTRAYADVAGNTTAIAPFGVAKLLSDSGETLYARPKRATDAPIGPARELMVDAMQAVVDEGTGRAAHPDGFEAAGKTGTSQDSRDAWFIGFTPNLTVGVWVGNDDNTPMKDVFGGDIPAAIFREFVDRVEPRFTAKPAPAPVAEAQPQPDVTRVSTTDGPPAGELVRGRPRVLDTGTLALGDRVVHLLCVEGIGGPMRARLARVLRHRDVGCTMQSDAVARCEVEGRDLSAFIIAGGGAKAAADAPPDLLAAEDEARSQRLGIWR